MLCSGALLSEYKIKRIGPFLQGQSDPTASSDKINHRPTVPVRFVSVLTRKEQRKIKETK